MLVFRWSAPPQLAAFLAVALLLLLAASCGTAVTAAAAGAIGPSSRLRAARPHRFHSFQFHNITTSAGDGAIYQAFPGNYTHGSSIRVVGFVNGSEDASTGSTGRRLLQSLTVPVYHFPFDSDFADTIGGLPGQNVGGGSLTRTYGRHGAGSLTSPSTPSSFNRQESLKFQPTSSTYTALLSRADFTQSLWVFTPPHNMAYHSEMTWVLWETVGGNPIVALNFGTVGYASSTGYGPLSVQLYTFCLKYTVPQGDYYQNILPWSAWVHITTRWTQSTGILQTLVNGRLVYAFQVLNDATQPGCGDTTSTVTDALWNPQDITYETNDAALPGRIDELWQFSRALTDDEVYYLMEYNTAVKCPSDASPNADGLTCRRTGCTGSDCNTNIPGLPIPPIPPLPPGGPPGGGGPPGQNGEDDNDDDDDDDDDDECPGQAGYSGVQPCHICRPGTYNPGQKGEECLLCDSGRYCDQEGCSSCTDAPSGYFVTVGGEPSRGASGGSGKQAARAGYYAVNAQGQSVSSRAVNEAACSAGQYQDQQAQTTCKNCDAGLYGTDRGATSSSQCIPCSYDTYNDVAGRATCQPCAQGRISMIGAVQCFDPSIASTTCAQETADLQDAYRAIADQTAQDAASGTCALNTMSVPQSSSNHSFSPLSTQDDTSASSHRHTFGTLDARKFGEGRDIAFSAWNDPDATLTTGGLSKIVDPSYPQDMDWAFWFAQVSSNPAIPNDYRTAFGNCFTQPPTAIINNDAGIIQPLYEAAQEDFATEYGWSLEASRLKLINIVVRQVMSHYKRLDTTAGTRGLACLVELSIPGGGYANLDSFIAPSQCTGIQGPYVIVDDRFLQLPRLSNPRAENPRATYGPVEFVFVEISQSVTSRASFSYSSGTTPVLGVVEAKKSEYLKPNTVGTKSYRNQGEAQLIAELLAMVSTNAAIAANIDVTTAAGRAKSDAIRWAPVYGTLTDGRYWRLYTINPSGEKGGSVTRSANTVQYPNWQCIEAKYKLYATPNRGQANSVELADKFYDWNVPAERAQVVRFLHGMMMRGYAQSVQACPANIPRP